MLIALLAFIMSPPVHQVTVSVTNVKSEEGKLRLYIYSPQEEFLGEEVYKEIAVNIRQPKTEVNLSLPPGEYAIFVAHDKNEDGEVNMNFLGLPKEGIGVTQNRFGGLSKPGFDECAVNLNKDTRLEIKLVHY